MRVVIEMELPENFLQVVKDIIWDNDPNISEICEGLMSRQGFYKLLGGDRHTITLDKLDKVRERLNDKRLDECLGDIIHLSRRIEALVKSSQ
jgi:hypothetical protein